MGSPANATDEIDSVIAVHSAFNVFNVRFPSRALYISWLAFRTTRDTDLVRNRIASYTFGYGKARMGRTFALMDTPAPLTAMASLSETRAG